MSGFANMTQSHWVADGGLLANRPLTPLLTQMFAHPAKGPARRVLAFVVPDGGGTPSPAAQPAADEWKQPLTMAGALKEDLEAQRPGPPSPGGYAPSPGSTSTPWKKSCSITLPPLMSAATWSRTRWVSALCGLPPRVALAGGASGPSGTGACCPRGPRKAWPPASGGRPLRADVESAVSVARCNSRPVRCVTNPPLATPGRLMFTGHWSARTRQCPGSRSFYRAGPQVLRADICEAHPATVGGEVAAGIRRGCPVGQTRHCAGGAPPARCPPRLSEHRFGYWQR
jgi:hypothetical protein